MRPQCSDADEILGPSQICAASPFHFSARVCFTFDQAFIHVTI